MAFLWEFYLSIGDDLEDLIERIKKDELNESGTGRNGHDETFTQHGKTLHKHGQTFTFHVELVTKKDRKKLENGDEQFKKTFWNYDAHGMNPDVSKEEMKASESDLKFALSLCKRSTYLISPDTLGLRKRIIGRARNFIRRLL